MNKVLFFRIFLYLNHSKLPSFNNLDVTRASGSSFSKNFGLKSSIKALLDKTVRLFIIGIVHSCEIKRLKKLLLILIVCKTASLNSSIKGSVNIFTD